MHSKITKLLPPSSIQFRTSEITSTVHERVDVPQPTSAALNHAEPVYSLLRSLFEMTNPDNEFPLCRLGASWVPKRQSGKVVPVETVKPFPPSAAKERRTRPFQPLIDIDQGAFLTETRTRARLAHEALRQA